MDVIERLEYQESIIESLLIRNYKLHCAVTSKRNKPKKPDFDFEILETAKLLNTSIYIFDPTPRINRFCKDAKFETLRDIVQFTPKELKNQKNFGMHAIREVEEMLSKLGLHLGMDVSMYPDLNQLHQEAKTRRNSKGCAKRSYD